MKLWMDVMRDIDHMMNNYELFFDAWEEGGVDGLVIGPLFFNSARLLSGAKWAPGSGDAVAPFDPNPAVYERFGVEAPPAPPPAPEQRALLERMLVAAKQRGWSLLIFGASYGSGPGGTGHIFADARSQAAFTARMVDTLEHYPMADGAIMDGPEWGYEIAPHFMNRRSNIFDNLPPDVAAKCGELGYDYEALVAAKDRLFDRLHHLDSMRIGLHAPGGLLGAYQLLGSDPDLMAWFSFRVQALTSFFQGVRQGVDAETGRKVKLGLGPRSAAFAPLCGYDMAELASCIDILLPKHYFWHRGFDGMVGTVYRYVETLTDWNPGLEDNEALAVVKALFGLSLPDMWDREDLENALTDDFFNEIVTQETERALAVVDDPNRIVPWVDSGRAPHDGDPMPAGDLRRLLLAAESAGLQRFLYHHEGNLTPGEWAVMSEICGKPWRPLESKYVPPDQFVL